MELELYLDDYLESHSLGEPCAVDTFMALSGAGIITEELETTVEEMNPWQN